MTTVLAVIVGASILAFFGCFFLGLCHDLREAHHHSDVVEVMKLSKSTPRHPLRSGRKPA